MLFDGQEDCLKDLPDTLLFFDGLEILESSVEDRKDLFVSHVRKPESNLKNSELVNVSINIENCSYLVIGGETENGSRRR
jgi:hypothetical protein